MKTMNLFLTTLSAVLFGAFLASAQVASVEDREAVLAKAERLYVVPMDPAIQDRFAQTADPFNLPEGEKMTLTSAPGEIKSRVPMSDRDILKELSEKIRPNGVMQFGEDILLIFGERRVRVGEFLSLQHQGQTYKVQVVKADTRAFMLRLNEELISKRIQ